MRIWYHYKPLAPVLTRYEDDGSRVIVKVPVKWKNGDDWEVALIGADNSPELIRVKLPHVDGRFTDDESRAIAGITEHMLCVVCLTFDRSASFARFHGEEMALLTEPTPSGNPTLAMEVSAITNPEVRINTKMVADAFAATHNKRAAFRLLADANSPYVPMQYQFLSLYKILEHDLRHQGKWTGLNELLHAYEEEFRALNLGGMRFEKLLHELRDKCVHIRVGSTDQLGIVGLGTRDANRVSAAMPLLRKVVAAHLMKRHADIGLVIT